MDAETLVNNSFTWLELCSLKFHNEL